MPRPTRWLPMAATRCPRHLLAVRSAGALALILTVSGCATYERSPLDPTTILADLRAVSVPAELPASEPGQGDDAVVQPETRLPQPFDPSDGFSIEELIALGVTLNPGLAASRAEIGVAESQLVQAGLLPDPSVGWDLNEDNLQVALPILRPGERDAKEVVAAGRIDEARWELLRDEWLLARDVHVATLELLGIRRRSQLNAELERVVDRTEAFFGNARSLGAATALEGELAAIQATDVRLAAVRLTLDERLAEQALNALLGLPPDAQLTLEPSVVLPAELPAERGSAQELTERALEVRPDLAVLLAAYEQAEGALALAVARQWPQLSIGTTVQLTLGVFSDFNDPAIQTAWLARDQAARRVEAAIHGIRAEVHSAVASLEQSRRQLELLERELSPRLQESLRLVELSVQAGQFTASDVLLAQGQVLDAQVQMLDVQIEAAKRAAAARWAVAGTVGGDR